MSTITVGVADDHHVVRHGLKTLFEAEPDFQVVGEAANGLEAIELVERSKPNVLILDLMMPGLNGLEVTRQISQRHPATRIVVLSMHANEAYVLEALRNGAAGYCLKDTSAGELVSAVKAVSVGQRYLSAALSERAIEAYVQRAQAANLDAYDMLTTREREVLHLAAEGRSNADIAERLFISARTVEVHRANLMHKLNLKSQTDIIRYAIKRGILPLED
jgi:DNA-binding NarL/FixJ family response regulator